jgi:hypothetical protein
MKGCCWIIWRIVFRPDKAWPYAAYSYGSLSLIGALANFAVWLVGKLAEMKKLALALSAQYR